MDILLVWSYWDIPEVYMESIRPLQERGHEVSVLIGDAGVGIDTRHLSDGVKFYVAPQVDSLSALTGTPYPIFKNVSAWIRKIDPEIVHVHNHLFFASYQAVKASRSLGLPIVLSIHAFKARRNLLLNTLQNIYARTVGKSIFEKASSIICLTKSDATDVAGILGGIDKISVIPNGVDTAFFKPSPEKDPDLISWVGRFVPEKGLTYLLEAMQKVVKEHPSARLVMCGDGIARTECMHLTARLGLVDRVSFPGRLDRTELAELLARTTVFAFPSLSEGLPRSVLEAMASGVPVVASDIPGIGEVITDGNDGLLVSPRDSDSLAAAILRVLRDSDLVKQLGENARRTAVQRFSMSGSVRMQESLYRESARRFSPNEAFGSQT